MSEKVDVGKTLDLSTSIMGDWLDVYGKLNMYPGAYVDWGIYAFPGSEVNIYAGTVGDEFFNYGITVEGANVTIFGTDFEDDDGSLEYGEWTPSAAGEILTGTFANSDPVYLLFYSDVPIYLEPPVAELAIDIKPGSYPNSINLGSKGVVPVAIFSSPNFDATAIPADTILLAGAGVAKKGKGKYMAHEEDVDGDGLLDLVVQVETQNIDSEQIEDGLAYLQIYETSDKIDLLYEVCDEVRIVPSKK